MTYHPGEISNLHIEGDITSEKANQIAKLYDKNSSSINIHCEFNCKLHDFTKSQHSLEVVNTEFINVQWRNNILENK